MAEDELVEIRRIRHEISEQYGHDTDRYVDHLQELQKRLRDSGEFGLADIPAPYGQCPPANKVEAAA
jgi:hypothetical protein